MIIAHVALQGFRDPDHQKEIAVRQAREAGIEGAEDEGFVVDPPPQRGAREIDVSRAEDDLVHASNLERDAAASTGQFESFRYEHRLQHVDAWGRVMGAMR